MILIITQFTLLLLTAVSNKSLWVKTGPKPETGDSICIRKGKRIVKVKC